MFKGTLNVARNGSIILSTGAELVQLGLTGLWKLQPLLHKNKNTTWTRANSLDPRSSGSSCSGPVSTSAEETLGNYRERGAELNRWQQEPQHISRSSRAAVSDLEWINTRRLTRFQGNLISDKVPGRWKSAFGSQAVPNSSRVWLSVNYQQKLNKMVPSVTAGPPQRPHIDLSSSTMGVHQRSVFNWIMEDPRPPNLLLLNSVCTYWCVMFTKIS